MPKGSGGSFDRLDGRAFVSSVANDADSLGAELFCLLLELIESLLASRSKDKSCSLLCQDPRTGLSDTGASASYEGDFSSEFCCHVFAFWSEL